MIKKNVKLWTIDKDKDYVYRLNGFGEYDAKADKETLKTLINIYADFDVVDMLKTSRDVIIWLRDSDEDENAVVHTRLILDYNVVSIYTADKPLSQYKAMREAVLQQDN